MAVKPPNEMVWDGWLEPLVVPTSWDLIGVYFYGESVWPYGAGVSYT